MSNKETEQLPVDLPYTYVKAWKVIGGINLPAGVTSLVMSKSANSRFILTRQPNDHLQEIDRGNAVSHALLRGLFHADKAPYGERIAEAISAQQTERSAKSPKATILIAEGYGTATANLTYARAYDGFVAVVDAIDKATIRAAHRAEYEAMKLALGFESEVPSSFEPFAEGIYLKNSDGLPVYSFTFDMQARGYLSSPHTEEAAKRVSERFAAVAAQEDLSAVCRLYSQTAENSDDPLRAFLFGWTAFEILLAKAFTKLERVILTPLSNGSQPQEPFLKRKFDCVTAILFPQATHAELEADANAFTRIKRMRGKLVHDSDVRERDLPAHDIAKLLRKYLNAYLDYQVARSPSDENRQTTLSAR